MSRVGTIGVVMSVLNGAALVDQTLASVAGQSRMPEQMVAVDDGSSDDTAEQMDAWSDRLPITVIRHPETRGLCAGKNAAYASLGTDLVIPLDGDDIWLPDHVEVLADAYERTGGIVSPGVLRWQPAVGIARASVRHPSCVPADHQLERLIENNYLFSGSMFARRDVERVEDPTGPWREFGPSVDWELWIRMTRAGVPVSGVDHPTVLYRLHEDSMSAGGRALPSAVEVLEDLIDRERDERLRTVAERSLRDHRARIGLEASYSLALEGRTWAARSRAWSSTGGGPGRRRNRMAMLIAPGLTAGIRSGRRYRLR